jgi:hypothetical protein
LRADEQRQRQDAKKKNRLAGGFSEVRLLIDQAATAAPIRFLRQPGGLDEPGPVAKPRGRLKVSYLVPSNRSFMIRVLGSHA